MMNDCSEWVTWSHPLTCQRHSVLNGFTFEDGAFRMMMML